MEEPDSQGKRQDREALSQKRKQELKERRHCSRNNFPIYCFISVIRNNTKETGNEDRYDLFLRRRGTAICRLLCRRFGDTGTECTGYVPQRFLEARNRRRRRIKPQDKSLSEWTGSMFGQKEGAGVYRAAGIAVRAIAPLSGIR